MQLSLVMLKAITSIKDEKIALARAIKSRKGRQAHQRILLEGEEILDWAIEHSVRVEYVLLSEKSSSETAEKYLSQPLEVFETSDGMCQ